MLSITIYIICLTLCFIIFCIMLKNEKNSQSNEEKSTNQIKEKENKKKSNEIRIFIASLILSLFFVNCIYVMFTICLTNTIEKDENDLKIKNTNELIKIKDNYYVLSNINNFGEYVYHFIIKDNNNLNDVYFSKRNNIDDYKFVFNKDITNPYIETTIYKPKIKSLMRYFSFYTFFAPDPIIEKVIYINPSDILQKND